MPRARHFAQVDVFSTRPYGGNPVAVVLDGTDLADSEMERIARWTNLSETTFVVPPSNPEADYRLRIFTPGGELPFAGHPTLGSAHAWIEDGGTPKNAGRVVQECGIGLVEVRRGDVLSFASPPVRRSGPIEPDYLAAVVDALGIRMDQVLDHGWADNGPGWVVLRLASAGEVLGIEPDFSAIPDAMVGVIGMHPEGSEHAVEVRAFAPGIGVPEDPVCGSMNAAAARMLLDSGLVEGSYRASQGGRLGRSGQIEITVDDAGTVWVGGATTTLISGTVLA